MSIIKDFLDTLAALEYRQKGLVDLIHLSSKQFQLNARLNTDASPQAIILKLDTNSSNFKAFLEGELKDNEAKLFPLRVKLRNINALISEGETDEL